MSIQMSKIRKSIEIENGSDISIWSTVGILASTLNEREKQIIISLTVS